MIPTIRARRIIWACVTAAAFLFGAQACDKQEGGTEGDEAEAVEADEQKESAEQARKGDESEEGAAAEQGDEAEAAETATIGEPAPDFTLVDAEGNEHSLSDYRGKPVVLEWTNPECPYVQRHYEAETMSQLHELIGGKEKVAWLAIDSTHDHTPERSKEWKDKHEIDRPILQDNEGNVGKMYGAKTTPHMFVVDKEGVLRYRGAIDDDPKGEKSRDERTYYPLDVLKALKYKDEIEKKQTEPYGCSVKYGG